MPGCTGCPWKPEQRHKSAGEIALLREIVAPIPHDRQSCATARIPRGLRRHIRRSLKWRPHGGRRPPVWRQCAVPVRAVPAGAGCRNGRGALFRAAGFPPKGAAELGPSLHLAGRRMTPGPSRASSRGMRRPASIRRVSADTTLQSPEHHRGFAGSIRLGSSSFIGTGATRRSPPTSRMATCSSTTPNAVLRPGRFNPVPPAPKLALPSRA